MSYADRIKARIKEADVEKQLHQLVDEGEKLVNEAVTTAGEIAYDRRDDVQAWLDQASGKVNEKTDGKYAEKVAKFTALLLEGVDKLADKRSVGDAAEAGDADAWSEPTDPIPLTTAEPGEPEPPAASATEPSTDAPPAPAAHPEPGAHAGGQEAGPGAGAGEDRPLG